MSDKPFEFDLYRLIISDDEQSSFVFYGEQARDNSAYSLIVDHACSAEFDVEESGVKNQYKWSLRDFYSHDDDSVLKVAELISVRFARSLTEQEALIVTDETIISGHAHAEPAAALPIRIIFNMRRHLVAVEHNSLIMATQSWRDIFHLILDKAAANLNYRSRLRLEPVPEANQVLDAFHSFQRLTRLRVILRQPNPEISRFGKELYEKMVSGGIKEYLQDMHNPSGLSQENGKLPHAVASLAQDGYKKGDVTLSGIRDHKFKRVRTGHHAARTQVGNVREFVRGQASMAKTQETRNALRAVLEEIDKVHPLDSENENRD